MRTLKFIVSGQQIRKDPACDFAGIVAGTKGYLHAEFHFSEEWEGLSKVVSFYCLDKEYPVVLIGGVEIPAEALTWRAFDVGVIGRKGEIFLTTNHVSVHQEKRRKWTEAEKLLPEIDDEIPEVLTKLATPVIYVTSDPIKLAAPVISLESDDEVNTTAVLGEAVLGYAILGTGERTESGEDGSEDELEQLVAPVICLETVEDESEEETEEQKQLETPVIYLETAVTQEQLPSPVIYLETVKEKLETPDIYLESEE